jgi:hypothetical protein
VFFEAAKGFYCGMATMVKGEPGNDDAERMGLAFGALGREDTLARMAEPELDGFEFLPALPFGR